MVPYIFTAHALLVSITVFLIICAILPIPVRSQSTSSSGIQVQFPTSSVACTSCKPAFASSACQSILNSIAQSPKMLVSNTTLADCQCSNSFLTLYDICVQCFNETDQLDLVFGSSRVPTQSSLNQYCSTRPLATTATKTVTRTSVIMSTIDPIPSPTNPSSGTSLKVRQVGGPLGVKTMHMIVALAISAYFSALS